MNALRIGASSSLLALGMAFAPTSQAYGIGLQNATATYSQQSSSVPGLWDPAKTIDGAKRGSFTSWATYRSDSIQPETIVWEMDTDSRLRSSIFSFDLYHIESAAPAGSNLGRFRISYTTDDRSTFADGLAIGGDVTANWTVVTPEDGGDDPRQIILPDSSILISGAGAGRTIYRIEADIWPVDRITGFRLETMTDPSLPFGGPGTYPGNGSFHLSEFVVNNIPEPSTALLTILGLAALACGRRWPLGGGHPAAARRPSGP